LSTQPCGAFGRQSMCPQCSEPSTESAAAVDQQIELSGWRKGHSLEEIQMQADGEVGTTPECVDGMFPAGAVDDDAGTAEPPTVMAGHDRVGYAVGQTAVVSVKNRNELRWTAGGR